MEWIFCFIAIENEDIANRIDPIKIVERKFSHVYVTPHEIDLKSECDGLTFPAMHNV